MKMALSPFLTHGLVWNLYIVMILPLLDISQACDKSTILHDETSLKKMIAHAGIAVKGLITNTYQDEEHNTKKDAYIAEVWLLDIYKGADLLDKNIGAVKQPAGALTMMDRRVNISHWRDEAKCWEKLVNQKTYIIMMQSNSEEEKGEKNNREKNELQKENIKSKSKNDFGGAVEFSQELEKKILNILGWNPWGEWSSCSATCGGGKQQRRRTCNMKSSHGFYQSLSHNKPCPSYDTEQRMCNSFECKGSVNALSVKESRYFKPSPSAFHMVNGRSAAWKIKPGSYFLLPYKQAFGQDFPKDSFTVFLTIKPSKDSEGVIFSLNARNSRQEHISLELKEGRLELVHSLPNGSNIIDIPAKISDGKWHQLAISIDRGSSVRTYLDCSWITTQILHKHSLAVPADTDLIVGYMFQGEMEQLTISKDSSAVSNQCSATRIPITTDTSQTYEMQGDDPSVLPASTSKDRKSEGKLKSIDPYDYLEEEYVDLDRTDSSLKASTKQTLKGSSKAEKLKVAKSQNPLKDRKVKKVEGSGEDDFNVITDDEDSEGNSEDEKEGSGTINKILTSPIIHHEYNEVANHHNLKQASNLKFELEWSSWSDCYIVSKGKKRYNNLVYGKPRKNFSECGIQKFSGRQYRTSRCLDNGFMEECIAAGKEHKRQTRKCTPSCKQSLTDSRPPKYLYDNDFDKGITPTKEKSYQHHLPKSEDYELVTSGDVEEVKRRFKKNYLNKDNTAFNNELIVNPKSQKAPERSNHVMHVNHTTHIKTIDDSSEDLSNVSFPDMTDISSKLHINEKEKFTGYSDKYPSNINLTLENAREVAFGLQSNCICKNGGTCSENVCHCLTGYSGKRCEIPDCRPNCLNGGECVDVNVCNCKDGYTGARCQKAFCHPECLNGGSCVAPFKCACPLGVSGVYCQEFSCQPKCANGGFCIGQNICSCPHGFSGSLCQDRTCTIHCENGGVCTMPGNKCKCRNGFYGSRCHKRICKTYVSIMKPRRQIYKRVVDKEYDTICGEENQPCKKFRPEHRTFIKVVQRPTFVCKSDIIGKP